MGRSALKIWITLLTVVSLDTFAQTQQQINEKDQIADVELRIYSATWCGPCKLTGEGLKKDGVITQVNKVLATGNFNFVDQNGKQRLGKIRKHETDLLTPEEFSALLGERNLKVVPTFEVLVNGKIVFFDGPEELAEQGKAKSAMDTRTKKIIDILKVFFDSSSKKTSAGSPGPKLSQAR